MVSKFSDVVTSMMFFFLFPEVYFSGLSRHCISLLCYQGGCSFQLLSIIDLAPEILFLYLPHGCSKNIYMKCLLCMTGIEVPKKTETLQWPILLLFLFWQWLICDQNLITTLIIIVHAQWIWSILNAYVIKVMSNLHFWISRPSSPTFHGSAWQYIQIAWAIEF